MHTLFVSKSRWHQLLTCITIIALFLPGCAEYVPPSLPPPPSEELRNQLGKIRISDCRVQPEVEFKKPDGVVKGAMKGAGIGLVAGLEGLQLGPAVILYAPASMVRGIVIGAQASQPGAKVKEFDKTFRATIQELNVSEKLRQSVADRIRILKVSEVTGPSDQTASIIMEVVVKKINFGHGDRMTPQCMFITQKTRLIRAADGMELYSHSFGNGGEHYSFDDWFAMDAAKLQKEIEGISHKLAEQIVDDIFYRAEEKK